MRREAPIEKLRSILDYNPNTGLFVWKSRPASDFSRERIWKSWNSKHSGKPAFLTRNADGYLHGMVDRLRLSAHRTAFAYVNGYWPELQIDHINGDVTDNRISNLREVSASVNGQNCKRRHDNTTGVTGVSRTKNSFRAEICVAGKRHRLGQFRSIEQAIAARKLAEREMGFHENHGR